ncbi:MAG: hypothetical protein AAF624_05305 [Bacteroidota bacterium]
MFNAPPTPPHRHTAAPRPTWRQRLHLAGVLGFTLTLLGGAVWIYLVLLQTSFGVLPWSAAVQGDTQRGRVGLLHSGYTAQVNRARAVEGLGVDAEWLAATVRTWRAYLLNRQVSFGELTDADLEARATDPAALADYDILVLPAAQALSDAQVDALKGFLRDGGAVLATWTPGVYRPDGSWRGHTVLDEIAGAQFSGFVEPGGAAWRVSRDTFPGTVPAGLYRPDYAVDPGEITPAQAQQNAQLDAADVAALGGYTWVGPPGTPHLAATFATAEPVRGGRTAVAYYTWRGGDATAADDLAAAFRRFTLRGGTPLTAGIPAGYQLRAGSFDAPITARPAEARSQVAGSWYDHTSDDRLPGEARASSAGLLYGRFGAGRFVFLGHELAAMGVGPVDQRVLARLFDNTFAWLARRPVAWVTDWPAPYRAAAVLAGSADTDPRGLDAMRAVLEPRGVPATYFLAADAAPAYADLYRRLDAHGEVGLLGPHRTDGLTPSALRDQRARLAETVTLAHGARLAHDPATVPGLDPYAAFAQGGFGYVALDSVANRAVPSLVRPNGGAAEGEPLVRLPRSSRSPRATLRRLPDASLQAQFVREDAARVVDAGGLAMLTFSGEDLRGWRAQAMLEAAVDAFESDGAVWFATASEVADWWRTRDRLTLEVDAVGPQRVHVRLANNGTETARQIGVTVTLGHLAADITVIPELVGTPVPEAVLSGDGETVRLVIAEVQPGATHTFHIDVEPTGLLAGR